jgi:O-antigen biosynthesis protein
MSAPPTTLSLSQTSIECLDGQTPVAVRAIDLEQAPGELRLPLSSGGSRYQQLLALVRERGYPLGWRAFPVSTDGTVSLEGIHSVVNPMPGAMPACEPDSGRTQDALPVGPPTPRPEDESLLSIVIATCANARLAVRCVEAIQSAASGPYEVIVVENRPQRSTVAHALEQRFGGDQRVRYAEEHRPGLACARNAGLRAARGELVAFTDDDVTADPAWLPAIRATFAAAPEVDCVTGLIVPLELETPTQLLVERFAGYAKGFAPRVYALDEPPPDQPLFPYTAGYFGSGANMAFRTAALRNLGGFDPVLGTGTPARGCEDLDICIRVLVAGSRLAYEPRAIVWHRHPDTHAHLRQRAFDYGAALGAMLTKHLITGPHRWGMVSRAPRAIRYYTSAKSRKNATRGPRFPASLTWLERVGLLYGPLAYLTSRLRAQR